jgi:5-hydroxyisourate hydrolase-like protein (transthyretin family)
LGGKPPNLNSGKGTGPDFAAKTANVEAGQVARLDFGAELKILFDGHVTRAGEPAKDEQVQFFPDGASQSLRMASTDADGRFEVDVIPGKYLVRIAGTSESIEIAAGVPRVAREFVLPTAALSGHVVNNATGDPLAGARVNVYRPAAGGQADSLASALGAEAGSARVADDGTYRVAGLAGGSYTITAGADGFATARVDQVQVPNEGERTGLDLSLEPGGVMRGRVVDEHGDPVSRASVSIVDAKSLDIPSGGGNLPQTDDDGRFEIRRFAPCRYRVTVLSETLAPTRQYVDFPGGTLDIPVVLLQGGALDLLVLDAAGHPLPGAAIELRYPDGGRVITGFIDFVQPSQPAGQDGRYRKLRLPPGALVGTARLEEPGKPARTASFQATIVNRADASAGVTIP